MVNRNELCKPVENKDLSFTYVIIGKKPRYAAHNWLFDIVALHTHINPELTMCTYCGGDRLLCDDGNNGLHTDMVITCNTCHVNDYGLRKKTVKYEVTN